MNDNTNCCRLIVDNTLIEKAKIILLEHQNAIAQQSKIFSLLGNEVRLKIMTLFLHCERMCVCDISDVLEMKQSPISQHLRKLKDADLLENKREGMTIFYFMSPSNKNEIRRILNDR
jgi:DNA-binding transcriptional ArsR family regulator